LKTTIRTFIGNTFDLSKPDPAFVHIGEIAIALSRINRFLGHTLEPYTVAEHCVRVSYLLADWGHGFEMQMRGLLHDAAEAFIGDITAPTKALIRQHTYALDVAEERIERAILEAVGLQHFRSDPPVALDKWEWIQSKIKRADLVMLATEQRDHMGMREGFAVEPLPRKLAPPLDAQQAEQRFGERYAELREQIQRSRRQDAVIERGEI
jgi:5'-deoxynucleotidase YfbR-like HD superfamily hydrolase